MDPDTYGLIEMGLTFGLVLGFCFWQLYSVKRSARAAREKATDQDNTRPD